MHVSITSFVKLHKVQNYDGCTPPLPCGTFKPPTGQSFHFRSSCENWSPQSHHLQPFSHESTRWERGEWLRIPRTFLVICAAHALGSVLADIFEETTTVHGSGQLSSVLSHNTVSFITLTRKNMHDSFCSELYNWFFFPLRILTLRGEDLVSLAQREAQHHVHMW